MAKGKTIQLATVIATVRDKNGKDAPTHTNEFTEAVVKDGTLVIDDMEYPSGSRSKHVHI